MPHQHRASLWRRLRHPPANPYQPTGWPMLDDLGIVLHKARDEKRQRKEAMRERRALRAAHVSKTQRLYEWTETAVALSFGLTFSPVLGFVPFLIALGLLLTAPATLL